MVPEYLSRAAVRDVDRRAIEDYGLPGVVLMENAGRGAAEWLLELGVSGAVVVCAGGGNNGGDGFVMARHLTNAGCDVRVLLFADPQCLRGDALINFHVILKSGASIACPGRDLLGSLPHALATAFQDADWIVDALLGTGTRDSLREPYPLIINAINQAGESGVRILAIDLPSGLDCDSGEPVDAAQPVIRATATATFVARKLGFRNPRSSTWTGQVRVIPIGVPAAMFAGADGTLPG